MTAASQLLALAEGLSLDEGRERCCFCGAACDSSRLFADYISAAFTDFASLAWPASDYVCVGCTRATTERGQRHPEGGPFGVAKARNYSWVLYGGDRWRAEWLTKADAHRLREVILDPPPPPLAVVIAVSGKKHLLPRARVSRERSPLVVQFEEQQLLVDQAALAARLQLTDALVPLFSKAMLRGDPPPAAVYRATELKGEQIFAWLDAWLAVRTEPLSELALFLTSTDQPKE